MTAPLVSVLTTVYNRERHLAQCIESVLASKFQDFEYIIVDDSSTDRSYETAIDYAKKDRRIRVYRNEKNLGDYPNRNRAASLAQSKYLKYVDSDDCIYPHGLGVMVDSMECFPQAALGLASLDDPERPSPYQLSPKEAYLRHYFGQGRFVEYKCFERAPLSAIVRREAFNAVGCFTGRRIVGDFEMWHIMAARFPVVLMPPGIGWDRVHGDQEQLLSRNDPRVAFAYHVIAREQLMKPECPLSPRDRDRAVQNIKRKQARDILRWCFKNRWHYALDMFRQSNLTVVSLIKGAFIL